MDLLQLEDQHRLKRPRLSGHRNPLACIGCKQKKLKCGGETPRCQNCIKFDRECLVEDPATGLHRPRDYMQSLENRVLYLEGLLQQERPVLVAEHLFPLDTGTAAGRHNGELPTPVPDTNALYPDLVNDMGELAADVALLCVRATSREPEYFGPSSALSLCRVVSSAMKLPKRVGSSRTSTTAPDLREERTSPGPSPATATFPSPSLRTTLSEAYFENIHPQYPFLHRPTFQAWQDVCVEAHVSGSFDSAGDVPLFFIWMVYAIGSLTLGPSSYDAAASYYLRALDHQPAVLGLDSLESIQSLLACAVYSIRSPVGASLWKISGMALRHCVELGYHESASERRHDNPLVAEMSRRCFWVAYDIDRVMSFILGRPVGIADRCIDAELPLDIEDTDLTSDGFVNPPRTDHGQPLTNMTRAIHVIKLRQIWSKINNYVYHPIAKPAYNQFFSKKASIESLAQELEEWHRTIPEPPESSTSEPISVFASRDWFRLAHAHSILMLYRSCIIHIPPNGEEEYMDRAFEICYNKSREMCISYRRLYQRPDMQFTWGLVHILFLGGITYLYCIWKSAKVRESARRMDVIDTCMACQTVLVIIAERWSHATGYRDIFEFLSEKTIDLVCGESGAHGPISSNPSAPIQEQDSDLSLLQNWIVDLDDNAILQGSDFFLQGLLEEVGDVPPEHQLLGVNGSFPVD